MRVYHNIFFATWIRIIVSWSGSGSEPMIRIRIRIRNTVGNDINRTLISSSDDDSKLITRGESEDHKNYILVLLMLYYFNKYPGVYKVHNFIKSHQNVGKDIKRRGRERKGEKRGRDRGRGRGREKGRGRRKGKGREGLIFFPRELWKLQHLMIFFKQLFYIFSA